VFNFSSSPTSFYFDSKIDFMSERTLRELVALDVNIQTLCVQYPKLDVQCKLKSGLIHLLPKFHGLLGEEDPHKHLNEFHIVCASHMGF